MKSIIFLVASICISLSIEAQIITTVAGNGVLGHTGDGYPATAAEISEPYAVKFDKAGNLYISESVPCTIRKITPSGIITTIAGNGSCGYNGDGIPATTAQLSYPGGIAFDSIGNLFLTDGNSNGRVRKVDMTTGIITTIAGTGVAGFSGDGGLADTAKLDDPYDVCFDRFGNLYIADLDNNRIRKVNPAGIITTVAGNGSTIFSGAGGMATAAGISGVTGLCTDTIGNLYLADRFASRVLKVDTTGILTVIAGDGLGYSTGDGGPATAAQLNADRIVFDDTGNLYISSIYKFCVRKIDTHGIIHTIVGIDTTAGYGGDGGQADTAKLDDPAGIGFDLCGNLYIADELNNRIRKVTFNSSCSGTLNVDVINTNLTMSLYPNPAFNELTISSSNKIAQITISNLIGQVAASRDGLTPSLSKGAGGVTQARVDVSVLPPGVYVVRVTDVEGIVVVRKVVKSEP